MAERKGLSLVSREAGAPEDDDARLLACVAARDRRAFEALYQRYYPRLFNYLFKVTRRSELVEELVNDVMFVIWQKAGTFDARSRPSTWILGIAYHKALKALARRDPSFEAEDMVPDVATEAGPDLLLARRELAATLEEAMTELSPEQRAVIELTYTYGYSCREIAALVSCPVNTVKTRMFHARRKLREALPEQGGRTPTLSERS